MKKYYQLNWCFWIHKKSWFIWCSFLSFKVKDNFYFEVAVTGSGVSAQAEAIRHGLSRNLASSDEGFKKLLKAAWFLTRDSRKVERKKPGKKKARKSPSWSKR